MAEPRFCVFCGERPESKNKEHVLPQWLIELTGDPRRVVRFGYNYRTKKEVAFAWQSLVAPACEACNDEYSDLEGRVKPIVMGLLNREDMPASEYLTFLDWLDKVRVGLWLTYHLIQGNPTQIKPKFHIKQRVRTKDRLVAIYPLAKQPKGLNAYGVETPLFHRTPSAFCLRINDLLVFNASSDYLIAGHCGLPAPEKMEVSLDGEHAGMLVCSDYSLSRKLESRLLPFQFKKPSVYLLQPITPVGQDGILPILLAGERSSVDSYVCQFIVGDHFKGVGKLVEQLEDHSRRIDNNDELLRFQEILGSDMALTGELVAQTYDFQVWLQGRVRAVAQDSAHLEAWNEAQNVLSSVNGQYADHYLGLAKGRS